MWSWCFWWADQFDGGNIYWNSVLHGGKEWEKGVVVHRVHGLICESNTIWLFCSPSAFRAPLTLFNLTFGHSAWQLLKWLKIILLYHHLVNPIFQSLNYLISSSVNPCQLWVMIDLKNVETLLQNGKYRRCEFGIKTHFFFVFSLIKKPTDRPGPEAMLEHAFIKERADPSQDLASWLKEVWNWK